MKLSCNLKLPVERSIPGAGCKMNVNGLQLPGITVDVNI